MLDLSQLSEESKKALYTELAILCDKKYHYDLLRGESSKKAFEAIVEGLLEGSQLSNLGD